MADLSFLAAPAVSPAAAEVPLCAWLKVRAYGARRVRVRIVGAAADDALGLIQRHLRDCDWVINQLQRREEALVVVFADEPDLGTDHAAIHRRARAVARGGDHIPAIARHPDAV